MKRSATLFLLFFALLLTPVAHGQDTPSSGTDTGQTGDGSEPKKKEDNSIILSMLPGPNDSMGLKKVFKHYGLSITAIEIDHPDSQDPITVKIRFDLPLVKKCDAPISELATFLTRSAVWQTDHNGVFLPMNTWARGLSHGHRELFLPEDCPS
ncbi:MAG: hypothetical protein ACYCT9_05515 [Leptospirillum sp.]|jgi:hypothetical protein